MATIFHLKDADVIEMTAGADVSPNDLINVGGKLGVALNGGASGDKISVKMTGVIEATKTSASDVIAFGDTLGAEVAPANTVGAGGTLAAVLTAVAASGNGDTTVLARLDD